MDRPFGRGAWRPGAAVDPIVPRSTGWVKRRSKTVDLRVTIV
jgi:hypothetical protein